MGLGEKFAGEVRKLSFFFNFLIFFGFFVFTSSPYDIYTLSFAKGLTARSPCNFSVQAKVIDVQPRCSNRRGRA